MKTTFRSLALTAAAVLLTGVTAYAQAPPPVDVTVTVAVNARASLSVAPTAIAFADADPGSVSNITAPAITVTARSRTTAGNTVTVGVQADGDFDSGTATIPASRLTWTSVGNGFSPGTMNTTQQTLGTWTGSGARTGTQTYALENSWDYAVGNYSMVVTYTLTAP